jgi:hypothetical protein
MSQVASAQQDMFSKIGEWQQSGLTQKGWCEKHQIKYHVFHYWYKRYRNDPSLSTQNQFIPLQVQPAARANAAYMELILVDGKRLLFHQPVSSDYLKALIS